MPNHVKLSNNISDKKLLKWFFIIIFIWAIPSTILWTSIYLFISEDCERKDNSQLRVIENKIEEIAHDSNRVRFFQKKFSEHFKLIKGNPANPTNLQKIIDGFIKLYPENMLDVYLFNGNFELIKTKNAKKEYEKLIKIASLNVNESAIDDNEIGEIGKVIPEPDLIIKQIQGQKDRAVELGNPDKYSLCYFNYDSQIKQQYVGAILIFVHYNRLKNKTILSETIPKELRNNFGYVDSQDIYLPKLLDNSPINGIFLKEYYNQNPTNRFRRFSKLVCLKRLSEHCLLVGVNDITQPLWIFYIFIGLIFIIISIFFFKLTYKAFVIQTFQSLNLRQRIIGLFFICYVMPIIVGLILASLYLIELKDSLLSSQEELNYKRLAEIDTGFSRFITSKLIEYRNINKKFEQDVNEPEKIVAALKNLCSTYVIDSAHMVSSDSVVLLSSALASAEVRRHKDKTFEEKKEIYDTWLNRNAILKPKHRLYLFESDKIHYFPKKNQLSEAHKAFIKVFSSAASIAMDYYNQSRNIFVNTKKTSSNLIVGAIVESHTKGLFQAAKSNISVFTPLEAMDEKVLAYLDVLPGPNGEAWYAYLTITNLDCLERMYLDDFFNDIKIQNSRINRVFPEEDIRAISSNPFATCFPSIHEYVTFNSTIKQSENDSKTFTHEMTLNNEKCFVSVLKCSYMKHYLLLKIFKEKDINEEYKKQVNKVVLIFIIIMVMGLALARILTKTMIMPIAETLNGVKSFANKDFNKRIKVRSQNELGIISNALNEAASNLENYNISESINKYLLLENDFRCSNYQMHAICSNTNLFNNDYYDCIQLKQGTYAIIVASISSSNAESIHLIAMLKTAFLTLMPNYPNNPEVMMNTLDRLFEPYVKSNHVFNCFIGILDPTNDIFICSNAGQPYPIFYDTKRFASDYIYLPSISLGLANSSNFSYGKHEITLKNKILVLYSHGVTELKDKERKEFKETKLIEIINDIYKSDNNYLPENILERLQKESFDIPWAEDISIITIQNRI